MKKKIDYNRIIKLMVQCGDELPSLTGTIVDIGVTKKWLTIKDIEIEKRFEKLINSFGENQKLYAEEFHDDFIEAEDVWILDPISDTNGFINDWPHYAIVISHMHKGELRFGAVYDPSMKELFTAHKGKGAYLNGNKIMVSKRPQDFMFIFSPRAREPFDKKRMEKLVGDITTIGTLRSIGSFGLHYCYVACGRADCVISLNKDTFPEFAGKIIVEEAGGILTDFNNNQLTKDSRGIIASRSDMHSKFLELVK